MQELNERIERFENMTAADPDNEMAHFSLGQAYLQADRAAEAAKHFEKCIGINKEMSKAYELAGEAMIAAGWADKAADLLMRGYEVAASKGDQLPRKAIAKLLESIGRTPPELSDEVKAQAEEVRTGGSFICQRTGRSGDPMKEPPMRGPIGKWIKQNISEQTWQDWIGQGTKVINELRLDFSRVEDQDTFDQYMYEFLGLDDTTREGLLAETTTS